MTPSPHRISQRNLPELPAQKPARRLSKGLLITFEGGEGVGKTTQAGRLARRLTQLGFDAQTAREPGGTALGEYIRTWVKREEGTSPTAETLLFAAARAQLVDTVIRPALRRGSVVILDRFIDSTVAYQGYGRGMGIGKIKELNDIATGGMVPDLTVLLDLDPESALKRVDAAPSLFDQSAAGLSERRVDLESERRFERQPIAFHQKVIEGYRRLAKEGGRWCVIRADQAPHRIADAIWKRARRLLAEQGFDVSELEKSAGEGDAGGG